MSAQSKVGNSGATAGNDGVCWNRRDWMMLAMLVALAVLVLIPGIFFFGIIDPSDGLYTECAREMIEKHNLLTPSFNYDPFYEKPILIYWLIIASQKLFGVSAWAGRLQAAVSGVLTVASLFALTRRFIGRRTAFASALILLSAPLFAVVGHLTLTDSMLTLFVSVATLCFFSRLHGGGVNLLVVAYLCLGLAVLAKGPVALVLSGAPIVLYLFLSGKNSGETWGQFLWSRLWRLHPAAGLLLIALISLPWYIAECKATNGEFFQEFFIRQNLGRATGSVNHQQAWYYYLPFLFGGFFPWWLFLAGAPRTVASIWRKRSRQTKVRQLSLLCLVWSVFIVAVFSAIKTKLGTYILPAFPPLAILAAVSIETMLRSSNRKPIFVLAAAIGAVSGVAALSLPFVFVKLRGVSLGTQLVFDAGALLLAAGFAGCAYQLRKNRRQSALLFATVGSTLAISLLIPAALHQFDKKQHRPFRQLLQICMQDHASVALFLRDSPAADFYLTRRVPTLNNGDDVRAWRQVTPGKHYLLMTKDVQQLAKERVAVLKLVQQRSKWYLYSVD
ncbi:MAG TPA: glycosyltransferase family 39 protein [Planktothrix sp.]